MGHWKLRSEGNSAVLSEETNSSRRNRLCMSLNGTGRPVFLPKFPRYIIDLRYRVVLDEAHNIKERSTNAAKAAFALKATYKWCLSGTPLQNRVGELYSLVRFLGADPFRYILCLKSIIPHDNADSCSQ